MKSNSKDTGARAYCRILDFVERVEPELANIIKHTCNEFSLNASKGKSGVTFLMPPKSHALFVKLETLTNSGSPEDLDVANDLINTHIFRDCFKTSKDWVNSSSDIPNAMRISQHAEIDTAKTSSDRVVFKNGATATLDKRFVDGSKNRNLAVWLLESGSLEITSDKPATLKNVKAKFGKGEVCGGNDNSTIRGETLAKIGAVYKDELANKHQGLDAFSRALYSLCAAQISADRNYFRDRLMPLVNKNKFSLIALLEPYGANNYLISDDEITKWAAGRNGNFNCSKGTVNNVDNTMRVLAAETDCAIYKDNNAVHAEINRARADIISYRSNPRKMIPEVEKLYDMLERNNSIGNVHNVFPAPFNAWMQENPGLKMLYDDIAYVAFMDFESIEKRSDSNDYNRAIMRIGENLVAKTKDGRAKSRIMLRNISTSILSEQCINKIAVFVMSTQFLAVPVIEQINNSTVDYPTKINSSLVYDVDKVTNNNFARRLAANADNTMKNLSDEIRNLSADERAQIMQMLV